MDTPTAIPGRHRLLVHRSFLESPADMMENAYLLTCEERHEIYAAGEIRMCGEWLCWEIDVIDPSKTP